MACDALAVRVLSSAPNDYGVMLLNLIQGTQPQRIDIFSVGISESGQQLKRRILALGRVYISRRLLVTSVIIVLLTLLGLLPWQAVTRGITAFAAAFADPQVHLNFTPLTNQETGFYRYASPTPAISPDGQRIYFITDRHWSRNDKPYPPNDILEYQRETGDLIDTGLPMANTERRFDRFGHQEHDAVFSADGRYVVYTSRDPRHVTVERYGRMTRIYRKDLTTGTVVDITRTVDGAPPNGASEHPAISGDGKVVAFLSSARNLTHYQFKKPAQAFPAREGFYLRDLGKGQAEFIQIPGVSGNMMSDPNGIADLRLSRDGSVIVFTGVFSIVKKSRERTAITSWYEPLAYDRKSKKLFHIGIDIGDGHKHGSEPRVSADGRFVVFGTGAEKSTCYLYDLQRHSVEQVGNMSMVGNPAISGDGRYIAFASRVPNPATPREQGNGLTVRNAPAEIYRYDRETKATTCISKENEAIRRELALKYYDNFTPSISVDGRYVCYATQLADRSAKEMSGEPAQYTGHSAWVIHVFDRETGTTTAPIVTTSWQTTPVVVTPEPANPVLLRRP